MDDRTVLLLEALDAVGVSLLVELLGEPATEAGLVESLPGLTQSTVNRRLSRLRDARLVAQEPGNLKAPGRSWTVVHPEETEALLRALFALSDTIEAKDRSRREAVKRKLLQARAARLGVRVVGNTAESAGER
jgi:predicted transcriptional regulator